MNIIRIFPRTAAVAALFWGLIASAGAAVDMYLKIEGIDGESTDKNHKDWIEVQSFSWGMSNSASLSTGGGTGVGKAQFIDLKIGKNLDRASPNLFLHGAQGRHIPEVVLVLRRAGAEAYTFFQITLTDV